MNTKDWTEDVLTVLPLALGGGAVFSLGPNAYLEPATGLFAITIALLCGGVAAMQGEPVHMVHGRTLRWARPLAWGLLRATVGTAGMLLALALWTARLCLRVMIRTALRG